MMEGRTAWHSSWKPELGHLEAQQTRVQRELGSETACNTPGWPSDKLPQPGLLPTGSATSQTGPPAEEDTFKLVENTALENCSTRSTLEV